MSNKAENENNKNIFDLEKVIQENNSTLLKAMPKFIIRWLEKVIMVQQANDINNACSDKQGAEFLSKLVDELNVTIKVENFDTLNSTKRYVFIANHPYGIVDGASIISVVARKFKEIKFVGNQLFNYIPSLRPIVVAVDVFGRNSKQSISNYNEAYASETSQIVNFPSGEVSRKYHKVIEDSKWYKSFLTKAIEHKRDIVPIFIYGTNSKKFHNVYKWRRRLFIPINFELILLIQEMFNKKGQTVCMKFGNPLPFSMFDSRYSAEEWTRKIRAYTYLLGQSDGIPDFIPENL
jgi:putative hemolysin